MTVELLQTLSLVSFILAGVFFVLAVLLFFAYGILGVIGDLTGATARKAIEEIRQQNEQSGEKVHRTSAVNMARGKVTDKISPSGSLRKRTENLGVHMGTQKFSTSELVSTASETTVLQSATPETTVLQPVVPECTMPHPVIYEIAVPAATAGETVVLSPEYTQGCSWGSGETTVLGATAGSVPVMCTASPDKSTGRFAVLVELAFVGSTEIIE